MKRIILHSILMLMIGTIPAQSVQFIPFGQTRAEVMKFLNSRDYIARIDTEQKNEICAIGKNYFLEYKFRDDKLYQISSNKYYPKSKVARPCVQNALGYFSRCKGDIAKVNNESREQYWMSVHEDRLMELKFISYDDFIKVSLISTSRFHGPRQSTEEKILAMSFVD